MKKQTEDKIKELEQRYHLEDKFRQGHVHGSLAAYVLFKTELSQFIAEAEDRVLDEFGEWVAENFKNDPINWAVWKEDMIKNFKEERHT